MISLFYIAYLVCVSSFPMPKLALNPINQSLLGGHAVTPVSCADPVINTWENGGTQCPCGAQIMDWERCQKAAAWFGVRYIGCSKPVGCVGRHQHKEPKGCIWRKDGDILFNGINGRRHKLSGGHRDRALVCARAPSSLEGLASFSLGGSGEYECPTDYVQVTSLEDCQEAAEELGIQWNPKAPFSNVKEPSGCSHRIDGDMIFNNYDDGMIHKIGEGEREIVCALF